MSTYICNECGKAFDAVPDKNGMITCPFCRMTQNASEADQPLAAGSRIKGYEIIRHLASGGAGDVYLAEQVAMERKVALKILNTRQMDPDNIERFLEEARNTAKFENPHVVTVLDVGVAENGCYFLATRYVEGETIEAMLNRGHIFSEEETLSAALDVGEALRSIWDKFTMFHKDIKPGNIMLTPEGEAVILDMGIAQERGASVLINGEVEGSPYYMSPEQAHGEELNWSTDLYSLGTTLYQMVTGVCPYEAAEVEEILQMHEHAPFPDPSERVPGIQISEPMVALIRKMMAKDPKDRFGSWQEFLHTAEMIRKDLIRKRKDLEMQEALPEKKETSARQSHSIVRFAVFGILLLLLAGALTAGLLLHFAARKNSATVRKMLDTIQHEMVSPDWNPEDVGHHLRRIRPYTRRFGVQPSLRHQYKEYAKQISERKKQIHQETQWLAEWEQHIAKILTAAEKHFDEARASEAADQIAIAEKHYKQAYSELQSFRKKILSKKMILPEHKNRMAGLLKRLEFPSRFAEQKKMEVRLRINEEKQLKKREQERIAAEKRKTLLHQRELKKQEMIRKVRDQKIRKEMERRQFLQYQVRAQNFQKYCIVWLALQKNEDRCSAKLPDFVRGPAGTEKIREKVQNFLRDIQMLRSQGQDFWKDVYDSKQRFKDLCYFTVPGEGKNMRLFSIHKNRIVLYKSGELNKFVQLNELRPAEFQFFLQNAAKQLKKESQYEAFRFLGGDYSGLKKHSQNVLVQRWLPKFRSTWYGFLAGEPVPGIPEKARPQTKDILARYGSDTMFRPYRKKIEKMNSLKEQTDKKERKGVQK